MGRPSNLKVTHDGKQYDACPICGGHCTTWAWEKSRKCTPCNKMVEQGLSLDKIRVLRATELRGEESIDVSKLPSLAVLESEYKAAKYDFYNTSPPGINIKTANLEEGRVLKETYEQFIHYGENIQEFSAIVTGILNDALEQYRISVALTIPDLPASERKGLNEVRTKMGDHSNKSIKVLNDLKNDRASRSIHVLNDEFGKMLAYHHDNDQAYQGIGICPDCNQRIMFQTFFSTFRVRYEEILETIALKLKTKDEYDNDSIDAMLQGIKEELTDDSIASTYIAKFKRMIEVQLM